MFLQLDHYKMDIYSATTGLVRECYKLSLSLPPDEKFSMISQIRRAALSVHLNTSEGFSRKSERERKRYFEVARGSVIEIDAALDIAAALTYLKGINLAVLSEKIQLCFKILTGLIKSKPKK